MLQETINIHYSKNIPEFKGKSGIYQIKINTKKYVGSTVCFDTRLSRHLYNLSQRIHVNKKLQNAYNKYGVGSVSVEILEFTKRELKVLVSREQYYMDILKPEYNILPKAHSCVGNVLSEETKKKISEANKGRKQTKEHIEKSRIAKIGQKRSKEFCEYMSKIMTGRKYSEERIEKTAKHHRGKILSQEIKDKIRMNYNGDCHVKAISATNIETNEIFRYISIAEAARQLNTYSASIGRVLKNKAKQHRGYTFKYD